MTIMAEIQEKSAVFFKNINTLLMTVITGVIIWIASTVISSDKKLSIMQEQIGGVKETVNKLETGTESYYTKQEVDKEMDNMRITIKQLREDLNLHINYSKSE